MLARELGGGGKEGKEGRKNEEEELTRCGEQGGTGWKKRREIGERSALYICVCVCVGGGGGLWGGEKYNGGWGERGKRERGGGDIYHRWISSRRVGT